MVVTKKAESIYALTEDCENRKSGMNAYLIVGQKRGLLLDPPADAEVLYDAVRAITQLPLDIVITSGQSCSVGQDAPYIREGAVVYMDKRDIPTLGYFGNTAPEELFVHVEEGMIFDLDGFRLEAMALPGYTPGALVLLEREQQILFSGDAVGSGTLELHNPVAAPLGQYEYALGRLWEKLRELRDLAVYPRCPSDRAMGWQYMKDILIIARNVSAGIWTGAITRQEDEGQNAPLGDVTYGEVEHFLYDPRNMGMKKYDPEKTETRLKYTKETIRSGKYILDYLFFAPEVPPGERYPLFVFLHGAGEIGSDVNKVFDSYDPTIFASPGFQREHPCFVFAPQCPSEGRWSGEGETACLIKAIQTLPQEYAIDPLRVYVTGYSMGGGGAWHLITKCPQLIAAAIPVCGGGLVGELHKAKTVPVWAIHAEDDDAGFAHDSYYASRPMVAALRAAGNRAVRYTEYPAGFMGARYLYPHATWVMAYDSEDTGAYMDWLFRQSLESRYDAALLMPGVFGITDCRRHSSYVVEGTQRALVIDADTESAEMAKVIGELTKLPYERVHSCGGAVDGIGDGAVIDLGGGVEVEVIALPGHAPGSVCYLDRQRRICFTGAAIGTDHVMYIDGSAAETIQRFQCGLRAFRERFSGSALSDVLFCAGQQERDWGEDAGFSSMNLAYIDDLLALCEKILGEDVKISLSAYPLPGADRPIMAKYKSAAIVFPEQAIK